MVVVLPATLEDIVSASCTYFRMTPEMLAGTDRRASRSYARMLFVYVARQRTRCSFDEIGEAIRWVSHMGAAHAYKRAEALVAADDTARADAEAIQRILDGEEVIVAGTGHVMSDREARRSA